MWFTRPPTPVDRRWEPQATGHRKLSLGGSPLPPRRCRKTGQLTWRRALMDPEAARQGSGLPLSTAPCGRVTSDHSGHLGHAAARSARAAPVAHTPSPLAVGTASERRLAAAAAAAARGPGPAHAPTRSRRQASQTAERIEMSDGAEFMLSRMG